MFSIINKGSNIIKGEENYSNSLSCGFVLT